RHAHPDRDVLEEQPGQRAADRLRAAQPGRQAAGQLGGGAELRLPAGSMARMGVARDERSALCDLFAEVGPDAPTLCGGWLTRDLAAHLVIRERRPDAAAGIVIKPLAG